MEVDKKKKKVKKITKGMPLILGKSTYWYLDTALFYYIFMYMGSYNRIE